MKNSNFTNNNNMKKSQLKLLIKEVIVEAIKHKAAANGAKRRFLVTPMVRTMSMDWEDNIIASSKEHALEMSNASHPDNPASLATVKEIPLTSTKTVKIDADRIRALEKDIQKAENILGNVFDKIRARINTDLKGIESAEEEIKTAAGIDEVVKPKNKKIS